VATESDLRDLLRGPDPEGRGAIDLDAVLSRTRRRRRPRVIAAQALGSVALVGVLGTVAVVAIPRADPAVQMTAEDAGAGSDEAATSPYADEDALAWTPDTCGAPATEPVGAGSLGLAITVASVDASAERVPVMLTLRNDGPERIAGAIGSQPSLSLALDGIVVWHSDATAEASGAVVDLAPGESTTWETYVDLVVCGSEDDLVMDGSQNDMPAAPPGVYEVRAVLVVTTDDGATLIAASAPLPLEIVG
jgi:hypothetical protein